MENNELNYKQWRNVRELSKWELNILRCQIAYEKYDDTQACPDYISDEEVFEYYEGTTFCREDFAAYSDEDEEVNS